MRVDTRVLAVAAACALLAGCGGGGSGSSATVLPGNKTPAAAIATFVVKVPAKAATSNGKRPAYITANVKGIDFTAFNTDNPTVSDYVYYALTPQSTYCTSGGSGLTCTLQVGAPPGADTFTVNLYDASLPGQGFTVATGSIQATIAAQQANTINVTTNGIPTWAVLGASNPYPTSGTAATIPLSLQVVDPDGNIIVGSFDMPLVLSDTDTSGATSLSKTNIAQTSDATGLTLSYTGSGSAAATINVTSLSPYLSFYPLLASVQITPGGVGPAANPSAMYFAHANSAAQTLTVTGQNGSTGPFSVNANSCTGNVTVTGSSPTFTITPASSTFTSIAPAYNDYGTCDLSVTDGASHTTTVGVMVGQ